MSLICKYNLNCQSSFSADSGTQRPWKFSLFLYVISSFFFNHSFTHMPLKVFHTFNFSLIKSLLFFKVCVCVCVCVCVFHLSGSYSSIPIIISMKEYRSMKSMEVSWMSEFSNFIFNSNTESKFQIKRIKKEVSSSLCWQPWE